MIRLVFFYLVFGCALQSGAQEIYPSALKRDDYDLAGPVKFIVHNDNCEPEVTGTFVMSRNDGCYYTVDFNPGGYATQIISQAWSEKADTTFYKFQGDTLLICLEEKTGFADSGFSTTYQFTYDTSQRIVKLTCNRFGRESYRREFLYDDSEKSMLCTFIAKNNEGYQVERTLYKYNSSLLIISESKVDKKNNPCETITYEYGQDSKLLSTITWKKPAKKKSKHPSLFLEYEWEINRYNEHGALMETARFIDTDKQPASLTRYAYNERNLMVSVVYTNYFRNTTSMVEIAYDSLGRKKMETAFDISVPDEGIMQSYTLYAYDTANQLTLMERHEKTYEISASGHYDMVWKITAREQYEYDHYGNWIKKYYLNYDGSEKIATRQISYYE
jgi:hypothetical protein